MVLSRDTLAAQAKVAGCFVTEAEARDRQIPPGSLFLVRRTATDWTHVGIVTAAHELHFETLEGNTNDDGSHEGYEVCARARGYGGKDFIVAVLTANLQVTCELQRFSISSSRF